MFTLFYHVYNVCHTLVHTLLRVYNLCLVLLNTIQRLLHPLVLRFNAVEGLQNFKSARAYNFTVLRKLIRDRLKTQHIGLGFTFERLLVKLSQLYYLNTLIRPTLAPL